MDTKTRFYTQATVLLTLIVLLSGVGGMAIAGLRREIDESARRTQDAERQLARLGEKNLYLSGQIARQLTPETLQSRLAASGLALTKPTERQIVRLEAVLPAQLAEAAAVNSGAGPASAATPTIEPFRTTYGLAVMGRD